jgi:hypothetical protein
MTKHLLVYLLEVICILATGHIGSLSFLFTASQKHKKWHWRVLEVVDLLVGDHGGGEILL